MSQESGPGASPEEFKGIVGAKDFTELQTALDALGGLQGSQMFYTPEDLARLISLVRIGEKDLTYITSTGGLRIKVAALIDEEKARFTERIAQSIPQVNDRILVTKLSIKQGEESRLRPGAPIEGVLQAEIRVGQPLYFGAGNTSPVQDIRFDGNDIIVTTATSVYEIRRNS